MAAIVRYLTLLEASRRLRVEPRTLARWARDGLVPAYKTPGGQWRFVEADLVLALGLGRSAGNADGEEPVR